MFDLLGGYIGERLQKEDYQADVDRHFWNIGKSSFWKLERQQVFQEPYDDSWVASSQGDWAEALRLLEARRPSLEEDYRRIAASGFVPWRVRVVEEPITSYMRWELHLLRLRVQLGEKLRIIGPEHIAGFERDEQLPELITLGDSVMYEILYDRDGLLEGGVRYVDRDLIARCRDFIRDLYRQGEEIESYFDRNIASLELQTR